MTSRFAAGLMLLAALLAAPALAQTTVPAEYKANLRKGVELHIEGKYAEAIPDLARARRIYPQDWRGHTWQALTLVNLANGEKDRPRKEALLKEAFAMQGPLLKQAGVNFSSPLRHYLNGLLSASRRDLTGAYRDFRRAYTCRADQFERYKSIRLRQNVKTNYALVNLDLGTTVLMQGKYEDANRFLEEAERLLPEDDPRRIFLHSNLAVVKEGMGQHQPAIAHLRRCSEIATAAGKPEIAQSNIASIALIHVILKDTEQAKKILAELPADCDVPKAIEARCRVRLVETQRDPTNLHATLAYFRKQIALYPEDEQQRLVIPYGELVVTYTPRSQAEKSRELLEDTLEMIDKERLRHPECPAPYWLLSKLHDLLGNEEKALEFQRLHEKKKAEFKGRMSFDKQGRLRCAGSG